MYPSVRGAFPAFTEPFEGRLAFMYCDNRGLVTTGVGNLIDPVSAALSLPWRRLDGTRATLNAIQDAWYSVKGRQDLREHGGVAYESLTSIRLDSSDIDALVFRRLDQMDSYITTHHACYGILPADAQLAVLSMAWAMGPAFNYPRFWDHLDRGDFSGAAAECTINPNEGTIIKRNRANTQLLGNAGTVFAQQLDPSVLHYPDDIVGY